MIDARELRVGNWVGLKGRQFQVYSFSKTAIDEYAGLDNKDRIMTYPWKISACSPIPLTPEILERCGEEYPQHFEWQFRVKISAISILFRRNSGIWYSELGGIYLGDKIQYLHQLQNLFWCLVGKELEIKL